MTPLDTRPGADPAPPAPDAFTAVEETDGTTVVTATRSRQRVVPLPRGHALDLSAAHPSGAFVVSAGRVRWRPAVDVTSIATTTIAVAGAVLVARQLGRRPSPAVAKVTMGPGGWVSMKGGTVALRPASRPLGRPHPLPRDAAAPRRTPLWARVLSAVPLQRLVA